MESFQIAEESESLELLDAAAEELFTYTKAKPGNNLAAVAVARQAALGQLDEFFLKSLKTMNLSLAALCCKPPYALVGQTNPITIIDHSMRFRALYEISKAASNAKPIPDKAADALAASLYGPETFNTLARSSAHLIAKGIVDHLAGRPNACISLSKSISIAKSGLSDQFLYNVYANCIRVCMNEYEFELTNLLPKVESLILTQNLNVDISKGMSAIVTQWIKNNRTFVDTSVSAQTLVDILSNNDSVFNKLSSGIVEATLQVARPDNISDKDKARAALFLLEGHGKISENRWKIVLRNYGVEKLSAGIETAEHINLLNRHGISSDEFDVSRMGFAAKKIILSSDIGL